MENKNKNLATRSGRIPQRPESSLLDYLIFPDDSDSDDEDFDPKKNEKNLPTQDEDQDVNSHLNHPTNSNFDEKCFGFDFSSFSGQNDNLNFSNQNLEFNFNSINSEKSVLKNPSPNLIDPSLNPAPTKLAPSRRYLDIAPNPNYSHLDHCHSSSNQIHHHAIDNQSGSESSNHQFLQSNLILNHHKIKSQLNNKHQNIAIPSSSQNSVISSHLDPDHAIKRKREGMRQSRERKKLYLVSLEDKCLELTEENAKLKEENQILLRESRENWKSKAKSLEIMKNLKNELDELKKENDDFFSFKNKNSNNRKVNTSRKSCYYLNSQDDPHEPNPKRKRNDDLFNHHLDPKFYQRSSIHSSNHSTSKQSFSNNNHLLDLIATKPR